MARGHPCCARGDLARGAALARLILDTSVLVAAERDTAAFEQQIGDTDDVAIAAITVAELLVGVELADRRRRPRRAAYAEAILGAVAVESYDVDVARVHASLLAHVRRAGRQRGAHDLVIAATAVARGRELVSRDERAFDELPGLTLRPV